MPTFLAPLALIGLASLPALAAIYWLRNRYRRQTVSSLMLWSQMAQAREGGTKLQRLQMPLLFLLELLALAMLVLAAAGPRMLATTSRLPLVVVLDDSYSMRAAGSTGDASARDRAMDAMGELIRSDHYTTHFILARARPQRLGDPVTDAESAEALLDDWACESPEADVAAAVALAAQIGGESGRVLVVTDREPDTEPEGGRVQWWAFGRDRPNVAIVNASRTDESGGDHRLLLEVANFSDQPVRVPLTIAPLQRTRSIDLSPRQTRSLFIDIPADASTLTVRLGDDRLTIDNRVTLEPTVTPPVRVAMTIDASPLRQRVRRAIEATGRAVIVSAGAQLLITDRTASAADDPQRWVMHLQRDDPAQAYLGPFVVDRAHPLSDGLALTGVIWAAGESASLPGRPIVTAGNITLVSDVEYPSGRHAVHLRLRPDLSSLIDSPNWPILWWNMIDWRAQHVPGLRLANVRVGQQAELTVPFEVQAVRVTGPDGAVREFAAAQRRVSIPAERAGRYQVQAGANTYAFEANVLDRVESDLSHRASGRWSDWARSPTFRWEYQSVAWVFGLIAAAALTGHLYLISRSAQQPGRRAL